MKQISVMGIYSVASNALDDMTFQGTLLDGRRVYIVDEQITMQTLICIINQVEEV